MTTEDEYFHDLADATLEAESYAAVMVSDVSNLDLYEIEMTCPPSLVQG